MRKVKSRRLTKVNCIVKKADKKVEKRVGNIERRENGVKQRDGV